jgi:uncharacterized protein
MQILLDTSFLLAISARSDKNHTRALKAMQKMEDDRFIIPVPVLPELFYMCTVRVNYSVAVQLYNTLQSEDFVIEPLLPEDQKRMSQIMEKYLSARFDFVDCAIMAMSERLNITRVATFDHRDFSIFRPNHCPALELVP